MNRGAVLVVLVPILGAPLADAAEETLCMNGESKFVRQAEFGPLDPGDEDRWCPKSEDPDGGCRFVKNGATYGTTHGFIVREEIRQESYSGKMPFGVRWGDTVASVERKIAAITKGHPEFERGASPSVTLYTKGGYCLQTKHKVEYMMAMTFDGNQKLVAIENRLLFP